MNKGRWIESMLLQFVIYFLMWQYDAYLGSVVSIIFGSIAFFILVVSIIVELIEPSRVPRWYYSQMTVAILAPIAAFVIFMASGGDLYWLNE